MKRIALALCCLSSLALAENARVDGRAPQYYEIAKVPTPQSVEPEVGGLLSLPQGRVAVAFHHGQVGIYDVAAAAWTIFATGLHEPLGLEAEADGSLLVMQRPELTRLRDTNGDGVADRYETVWDDFGMTGNYHEFAFGPVRAPNGQLIVSLNCASNGDTIFKEVRGQWLEVGMERSRFYGDWNKVKEPAGRMYSRVPWRGWVLSVDPATGKATPLASGFRSPDGIGFDAGGRLLVDDNQGDWRGTNELHVVEPGKFYGHPASLPWREGWTEGDPLKLTVERLNQLRTPPAVQFPYGRFSNSPTQIITIPKTPAWGAFGGQTLVGEMNSPRLLRVMLEKVRDVWQGACVALIDTPALKRGLHRLAFVGDSLWIGRTHLSWAGDEGLATVKPKGKIPFDPLDMKITKTGFRLTFTEPLAPEASDPKLWAGQHFSYLYHATYGSPEIDKTAFTPSKVTLSADGLTADIAVAGMKAGLVYEFDLKAVTSKSGDAPLNPLIAYTANRLP